MSSTTLGMSCALLDLGASDIVSDGCGWLFGNRENRHSLAPVVYRQTRRITSMVGVRTVTAALS